MGFESGSAMGLDGFYNNEKLQPSRKVESQPQNEIQPERKNRRPKQQTSGMWAWLKDVANRRLTSRDYRQPLSPSRAQRAADREAARAAREAAQAEARQAEIGHLEAELASLRQRYLVLFGHEGGQSAAAMAQADLDKTQAGYERTLGLTDKNAETPVFGTAMSEAESMEVTQILHDFDQEELTADGSESWNAAVRMAKILPEAQRLLIDAETMATKLALLHKTEGQEYTSPAWLQDLRKETEALVERAPESMAGETEKPSASEMVANMANSGERADYGEHVVTEPPEVTIDFNPDVVSPEADEVTPETVTTTSDVDLIATAVAEAMDYADMMEGDQGATAEMTPSPEVETSSPSMAETLAEIAQLQKELEQMGDAFVQEVEAAKVAEKADKQRQAEEAKAKAEWIAAQNSQERDLALDQDDSWRELFGDGAPSKVEEKAKIQSETSVAKTEENPKYKAETPGEKVKQILEATADDNTQSKVESHEAEKPFDMNEYRQYLAGALWTNAKLRTRVTEAATEHWSRETWDKKMESLAKGLSRAMVYSGVERSNDANLRLGEKVELTKNQLLDLIKKSDLYEKAQSGGATEWLKREGNGWSDQREQFGAFVRSQSVDDLDTLWAAQQPKTESTVADSILSETVEQSQPEEKQQAETATESETSVDYKTQKEGDQLPQEDLRGKVIRTLKGKRGGKPGKRSGKRWGVDNDSGNEEDYTVGDKRKNSWKNDRRARYDAETSTTAAAA